MWYKRAHTIRIGVPADGCVSPVHKRTCIHVTATCKIIETCFNGFPEVNWFFQ
jgi:hypothetical protein